MAASFEEFQLWKVDRPQEFLRDRGIPTRGRKEELLALAYGAQFFKIPICLSATEKERNRAERYCSLLTISDQTLPDPFSDLSTVWIGESQGMSEWPPTMYGDLAEYLVQKGERDLRTRLLTDYKEGKAYSYFDSKRLREVYYHKIHADSPYCFVKSECCPSMKVSHEMHKVWICIHKKSGKIISAYCSCFAGYVS